VPLLGEIRLGQRPIRLAAKTGADFRASRAAGGAPVGVDPFGAGKSRQKSRDLTSLGQVLGEAPSRYSRRDEHRSSAVQRRWSPGSRICPSSSPSRSDGRAGLRLRRDRHDQERRE
jgi:hypothetical protein